MMAAIQFVTRLPCNFTMRLRGKIPTNHPRPLPLSSLSVPEGLDNNQNDPIDLMISRRSKGPPPSFLVITLGNSNELKTTQSSSALLDRLAQVEGSTVFHCQDQNDLEILRGPETVTKADQVDLAALATGLLDHHGVHPASLDGVLIRTDPDRYLARSGGSWCSKKALDLRRSSESSSKSSPSASQVLQHLDERPFLRLLRTYSRLRSFAKPVASAIMEARFLFYKFATAEELSRALSMTASNICASSYFRNVPQACLDRESLEQLVLDFLMRETLTALGCFVNDDFNKLDFAIRSLAWGFLRPVEGLLVASVHSDPERKVVDVALKESENVQLSSGQHYWQPWKLLRDSPQTVSSSRHHFMNDNPSHLFIASRKSLSQLI